MLGMFLKKLTNPGVSSFFFFKTLFICRQRGREKERERNSNVWLPLMHPSPGTWPATQTCALTGNRTSNPLVLRLALNPLSHTSQGWNFFLDSSLRRIVKSKAVSTGVTDVWLEDKKLGSGRVQAGRPHAMT